jgi:cytochrome c peroxidase
MIKISTSLSLLLLFSSISMANNQAKEALGKLIFFDKTLSQPSGQACATCHQPDQGFANKNFSVSPGANNQLFGNRNAPSIAYASYTVDWHYNSEDETWMGGFFLDGRAKTLLQQAKGPFVNPLEMANASGQAVVDKVLQGEYKYLFEQVYGAAIWHDKTQAFDAIADALVAYQSSETFAPRFSAKYDAYLQGNITLSAQEMRGLKLFEDPDKGNCAACHPSQVGENGEAPIFTDFSYDNLGVPRNKQLAFYQMAKQHNSQGTRYRDKGLGDNAKIKNSAAALGKFKVPTLRNIALTAPYMHNGVFATLEESVDFYNSRDIDKKWAKPEISENVNKDELGDLQLTDQEVKDLVVFLKTLDDGFIVN